MSEDKAKQRELDRKVRECIEHLECDLGKEEALVHLCQVLSNRTLLEMGEAELTDEERKLSLKAQAKVMKEKIAEKRRRSAIIRHFSENVRGHMDSRIFRFSVHPVFEDYVKERWSDVPLDYKDLAEYGYSFVQKINPPPADEPVTVQSSEPAGLPEKFSVEVAKILAQKFDAYAVKEDKILRQFNEGILLAAARGGREKTFTLDKGAGVKRAAQELEKRGFVVKQAKRGEAKTTLKCSW